MATELRIVQYITAEGKRKVGRVDGDRLHVVQTVSTTFEAARAALDSNEPLNRWIDSHTGQKNDSYREALAEHRVLAPLDHPDPRRFWITGTGLTHLGSATARDEMHVETEEAIGTTDTMRMFRMGIEGGKPKPGSVGVQPEWFFKGDGSCVAAPEEPLFSPDFALLDGDEIEVCVLYVVDDNGQPRRIGFALGNEFSDHRMEKQNYLYLAHSKLRPCSFGPELLLGDLPDEVTGTSRILRNGEVVWEKSFLSGERHMSHSLDNLEHHLFKYPLFRHAGDLHGHFLGTATASFSDGFEPESGDVFEMEAECFGASLRNPLRKSRRHDARVEPLYKP